MPYDDTVSLFMQRRAELVDCAASIVGCRSRAEDVVPEAYLRFDDAAERGRLTQPTGYLFRIVRNLNAGVRHVGSSLDYANTILLFDGGWRYDFPQRWEGLSISLNVSNMADKTYISSCEGEFWCIYGLRRVRACSRSFNVMI